MQLNPYLVFNGACEQALKYYEQAIGGKIKTLRTPFLECVSIASEFRGWLTAYSSQNLLTKKEHE